MRFLRCKWLVLLTAVLACQTLKTAPEQASQTLASELCGGDAELAHYSLTPSEFKPEGKPESLFDLPDQGYKTKFVEPSINHNLVLSVCKPQSGEAHLVRALYRYYQTATVDDWEFTDDNAAFTVAGLGPALAGNLKDLRIDITHKSAAQRLKVSGLAEGGVLAVGALTQFNEGEPWRFLKGKVPYGSLVAGNVFDGRPCADEVYIKQKQKFHDVELATTACAHAVSGFSTEYTLLAVTLSDHSPHVPPALRGKPLNGKFLYQFNPYNYCDSLVFAASEPAYQATYGWTAVVNSRCENGRILEGAPVPGVDFPKPEESHAFKTFMKVMRGTQQAVEAYDQYHWLDWQVP